jgi:hypothetical protein
MNFHGQSGIGNDDDLDTFCEINYFENKNLNLKKITFGGNCDFSIFLTGFLIIYF